jgi:hypothetical protein
MKALTAVALAIVFGLMLTAPVFAQDKDPMAEAFNSAIARGNSGTYRGVDVVSCNAGNNTCVVNTPKKGQITANFQYGQYNGRFNAAKDLKAGDKISGQFHEVDGKYYATSVIQD